MADLSSHRSIIYVMISEKLPLIFAHTVWVFQQLHDNQIWNIFIRRSRKWVLYAHPANNSNRACKEELLLPVVIYLGSLLKIIMYSLWCFKLPMLLILSLAIGKLLIN